MNANGARTSCTWTDDGELPAMERLCPDLRRLVAYAPFRLSAQAVEAQWIQRGRPKPGTFAFELFIEGSRERFERLLRKIVVDAYGRDHPQAAMAYDDVKEIRDGTRVHARRRGALGGRVHGRRG